jgi:hypothetical protein
MSRGTPPRIAIALLLGGGLLVSYPAVSGGVLWDIGLGCGYICLILVVSLYLFPVRGDGLPHARLWGLPQHRSIGWWVLGAGIAHVVALLVAEPKTGHYLLPSAPLFMWCGTVALLSLLALVFTRATLHIVLAAIMMLAACAHIVGSSQLLSGAFKLTTVLLLIAVPLAWYATRQRRRLPTVRRASHIAAVALIALLPAATSKQILLEPATRPDVLPASLPHDKHTSVSCVACHHNYVDHTGTTACLECHRTPRPDIRHSSEATFHRFCRDCHTQLALDGHEHGPTRSCSECHQGMRSSSF